MHVQKQQNQKAVVELHYTDNVGEKKETTALIYFIVKIPETQIQIFLQTGI